MIRLSVTYPLQLLQDFLFDAHLLKVLTDVLDHIIDDGAIGRRLMAKEENEVSGQR